MKRKRVVESGSYSCFRFRFRFRFRFKFRFRCLSYISWRLECSCKRSRGPIGEKQPGNRSTHGIVFLASPQCRAFLRSSTSIMLVDIVPTFNTYWHSQGEKIYCGYACLLQLSQHSEPNAHVFELSQAHTPNSASCVMSVQIPDVIIAAQNDASSHQYCSAVNCGVYSVEAMRAS